MMNWRILCILVFVGLVLSSCSKAPKQNGFVTVENGKFLLNDEAYIYAGTNYWQGMHLGSTKYGDRDQLKRELDQLKAYGITNLRVMASCEADKNSQFCMQPPLQSAPGVYDDNLWEGLDFLLAEMAKREMKAVMVLSNFWSWSGGFSQYLKWDDQGKIPYPQLESYSWWDYGEYTKHFFTNENCVKWYNNHVVNVVNRVNSITGLPYRDDTAIMAWQLANEPRGYDNVKPFASWVESTADLIKSIDRNHLVSVGSEGNTPSPKEGLSAKVDNAYKSIDYITMHIWVQNWNWYTPGSGNEAYESMIAKVDNYWADHVKVSGELNKPLVLEEYGLARDSFNYNIDADVLERNKYYDYVYSKFVSNAKMRGAVQGVNFWSYSGEGRPAKAGEYWKSGDDFVGDPPHELQGWYGVYDTDLSTLEVIKKSIDKIKK